MVTWRREYLVEVAAAAEERVRTLFGLFDVEAPPVRLTPGMVQMVLEAHEELVTVKNGQSEGLGVTLTWNPPAEVAGAPADVAAVEPVEELPPAEATEPVDPVAHGLEVVRSLAVDGELPSMAVYNRDKPADAPTVYALLSGLGGIRWTDLAERLGLRLTKQQRDMLAVRERAAATTEPDMQPAGDEDAPAGGVSAAVASVLGPEHVVVTPHGSERTNGRGVGAQEPPAQRPPEAISGTYRSKMMGQAKAFLRRIAVDEVMPTPEAYNAARPSYLPDADGLMWRLNMTWDDVMVEAGLKSAEAVMAPPTLGQAQRDPMARRAMLEEVIFRLRDMAADGMLPSSKVWNDGRGELPPASDLVLLYNLDAWQDMAAMAKLELPGKRRGKEVVRFRS